MPSTHHDPRLASHKPGDRQLLKDHPEIQEKTLVVRGKIDETRKNTNHKKTWASVFLKEIKEKAEIRDGLRIDFEKHVDQTAPTMTE